MKSEPAPPTTKKISALSPLRYPGGKGKLAPFVKRIIEYNSLHDGTYVEPYAGGAAIALELLFESYVDTICINDISRPIFSFWHSVLNETDRLVRRISRTPLSVKEWDKQKRVVSNPDDFDELELGFATFYLNRTNRSGILNGGIIGGRDQSGPWKIDARYNAAELVRRIEAVADQRSRISLTNLDALRFLRSGFESWSLDTLVYLDPPYYIKGKDLYLDFYEHDDHVDVAELVTTCKSVKWIVSYDNIDAICKMYGNASRIFYALSYSARESRMGSEVMFFDPSLRIPGPTGAMTAMAPPAWLAEV